MNKDAERQNRENAEGWLVCKKALFVLNGSERNIISHLLSEEIERLRNKDKMSIEHLNLLHSTKGHILNGGEDIGGK